MINAEIAAYSVNQQGDKLMSVLCTFPRIILAEVNTHRMLSKNTSSSRAIPFKRMVQAIQENPFIPIAWQEDHSGMQGVKYLDTAFSMQATQEWLIARDYAISIATQMNASTYVTKQLANRLLEPFMWTTMLITGSEEGWDNFFKLRCPQYVLQGSEGVQTIPYKSWKDVLTNYDFERETIEEPYLFKARHNKGQAEIHMMALAEAIWDAKNEATPKLLQPGEWHIPFEDKFHQLYFEESSKEMKEVKGVIAVKVSTAMGARTSYTVIGEEKEIDYNNLIGLHDRLITQQPPHSSPMEHCSKCMSEEDREYFIKGKLEFGTELDSNFGILEPKDSEKGWCYNHKGFIPYRYLIDNNLTL
jgi:hypothetical protein